MLTAGHGEDHLGTPRKGVEQGVIRGGIAGVEGHHHIHGEGSLVAVDVPQFKAQAVVAVFSRRGVAFFDDVRFEIQPDHLRGNTANLRKVIIQNEGQIAFAAAKVIDDDRSVPRKSAVNVVNQFQKAVDLSEFCAFFVVYAPVLIADLQLDQKGFVARQDVLLFSIVE